MKRWIAAIGLVVAIAGVTIVTPLTADASVEDFSFSKFDGQYSLSRDSTGRSTMKITEQLVAEFPDFDQNKGIIRSLPLNYDGHSVSLRFDDRSLTRNGNPEPVYDKQRSNGNLDISTGTESYVTGTQTYALDYSVRDVTKDFGDHQELYWDSNGTQWQQRFGLVQATVHIDASLSKTLTGETACYQGVAGAKENCAVSTDKVDQDTVITFRSTRPFASGENLTFVIGFAKGTFTPYQMGVADYIMTIIRVLVIVAALIAVVWAIILKVTRGRNAIGRGTVVPEYLPPKGIALLMVSDVAGIQTGKEIAAQIVDLAVRHNIQIVEYKKTQLFGKKKAYRLEYLNDNGMNENERAFASVLFGTLTDGATYDMGEQANVYRIAAALSTYKRTLSLETVTAGYRRTFPGRYAPIITSVAALFVGIIMVSAFQSDTSLDLLAVLVFVVTIPSLLVTISLLGGSLPLTEKGVALRDYLKGLGMYIKTAEADRLKILQSVEGAIRTEIGDVNDRAQLVKLYERVLPYAILLGLEKSWAKVLEQYYDQQTHPVWYVGVGAFSVDSFTSSLSSFAASTSSSSSGLGGGGSSGGGGGGGGGGGR